MGTSHHEPLSSARIVQEAECPLDSLKWRGCEQAVKRLVHTRGLAWTQLFPGCAVI